MLSDDMPKEEIDKIKKISSEMSYWFLDEISKKDLCIATGLAVIAMATSSILVSTTQTVESDKRLGKNAANKFKQAFNEILNNMMSNTDE